MRFDIPRFLHVESENQCLLKHGIMTDILIIVSNRKNECSYKSNGVLKFQGNTQDLIFIFFLIFLLQIVQIFYLFNKLIWKKVVCSNMIDFPLITHINCQYEDSMGKSFTHINLLGICFSFNIVLRQHPVFSEVIRMYQRFQL